MRVKKMGNVLVAQLCNAQVVNATVDLVLFKSTTRFQCVRKLAISSLKLTSKVLASTKFKLVIRALAQANARRDLFVEKVFAFATVIPLYRKIHASILMILEAQAN